MKAFALPRVSQVQLFPAIAIILLDVTAVVLIGAQSKPLGWYIWGIGVLSLGLCAQEFRKELALVYFAVAVLGVTPISTDLSTGHALFGTPLLTLAILVPYAVSRYIYRDRHVRFQWHHGRNWYGKEIAYVGLTAIVAYLLLPFMMRTSGSYIHWTVGPDADSLVRLFIGCIALGIWDELFFVCTVLGILRRHLAFPVANVVQAVLFTAFLYELGFRGWAAPVIFVFALMQGYIFSKTESLFYVVTIHLVADIFLYLALIYAYHPSWTPIFIT